MLSALKLLETEAGNEGLGIAFSQAEDGTPYGTLHRFGTPLYGLERRLEGWVIYSLENGALVRGQKGVGGLFRDLGAQASFQRHELLSPVLTSADAA